MRKNEEKKGKHLIVGMHKKEHWRKEGREEEIIKMTIVQRKKERKTSEGIYEMGQNEATKGSGELIVFRWCDKV